MTTVEKQITNLSEEEAKDMLIGILNDSYSLVLWPESQDLMEKEWFNAEAILDVEGKFGSAAYFIPTFRLYEDNT